MRSLYREVAEHNYVMRFLWEIPRTVEVPFEQCRTRIAEVVKEPEISFSSMTTADALLHFASLGDARRKVCGVNFANGVAVGGGYKSGAIAQEEDLCRRMPALYTSLINAKRDGLYPFGPSTCASRAHPAKYSTVLYTPDVVLARAGEIDGWRMLGREVAVSLVAAAAPNIRFADPPEICDPQLMYDTVTAMFKAPRLKQPEVTTLIVGAWGCGAFGGDPNQISDLFCKALQHDRLGCLYREVHFAIPRFGEADHNCDVFREALRSHGIRFRDLDLEPRLPVA